MDENNDMAKEWLSPKMKLRTRIAAVQSNAAVPASPLAEFIAAASMPVAPSVGVLRIDVGSPGAEQAKDIDEEDMPPILSMNDAITLLGDTKTIDWRRRCKALAWIRTLVDREASTPAQRVHDLGLPVQELVPYFVVQLKDLRSAIVREACETLRVLARTMRGAFSPAVRDIVPTMLELTGGGNKVITRYVATCLRDVISASPTPEAIVAICSAGTSSRSRVVRENALLATAAFILSWKPEVWHSLSSTVVDCIKRAASDASSSVRSAAREAFIRLRKRAPEARLEAHLFCRAQDPFSAAKE